MLHVKIIFDATCHVGGRHFSVFFDNLRMYFLTDRTMFVVVRVVFKSKYGRNYGLKSRPYTHESMPSNFQKYQKIIFHFSDMAKMQKF